ncbi:MAG: HAMP domain-containing sensor histidine kinase, partial [Terracidiphilus sp.]
AKATNKGIQLDREVKTDLAICAIPGEIRQLVANLVSNSIDAIHGAGRIRIRVNSARHWANRRESGIRITVSDTGIGISSEARPRVFEPFFTTKRDVGTGLGLWVCKSIVDNHHGDVQIRSSATPGESWTVVSIFLPLNQPLHSAVNPSTQRDKLLQAS